MGKCRGHSRKNTVLWHILQTAGVSHILYRVGKILVPRIHFRALNFCPEHKSDLFFSFKDGKRSPARWEFHQKCKLLDYLRPSPQQTQAAMRFKNQAERRRFPMFWTEFVVEEHQKCKGGGVWGWRHGQVLEERMYLNLKLNVIIHFHSPTTHADTSNSTIERWWWVEDVFAPFLLSLASKNTKDALGRNWGWRHGELLEKLMYLTLVTFDIAHFYHTNRCEW